MTIAPPRWNTTHKAAIVMVISILFLTLLSSVMILFIVLGRPRFLRDDGHHARIVVGLPQLGQKPRKQRLERCKQSIAWRDGRFRNEHSLPQMKDSVSTFKVIREFLLTKQPNKVPPEPLPAIRTDFDALPSYDLVVWLGHSGFLLQVGGVRLLVDPVLTTAAPVPFLERPFPGTNIFTPRDLPGIDALIITHNHYDHLDYDTVRNLRIKTGHVYCPLGVGADFEFWGWKSRSITELDWWQSCRINTTEEPLDIICTPQRHFSGRKLLDSNRTLWASFVIRTAHKRLFLGGDGGYDDHFRRIGEKYGPFDLAFMENGQYDVYWHQIHTMPEQMEQACRDINARVIFSIHNGKFALARHPWDEPQQNISRLRAAGLTVLSPVIGEVVKIQ